MPRNCHCEPQCQDEAWDTAGTSEARRQPWGLGVLCNRLAAAQAAGCRRACPVLLILSLVVPSLKQEDHSQQPV